MVYTCDSPVAGAEQALSKWEPPSLSPSPGLLLGNA